MSRNRIRINAPPEAVFDTLDDPYAYPQWVVGTRRIRAVDDTWPAPGSEFHHAVGTAAGEIHDSSKILRRERPHLMSLEVRFRPTGVARVDIRIEPDGSGSVVTLEETPTDGPLARLPRFITDPVLGLRNGLSLPRLRREIERRATLSS
jgi:uncharacterized protein YndB with AHSA1/START domain